jgi:uncharacterized protein (TIGR02996 family)
MRDNPEFIAAIMANPDDDGLRLIYADWLDEHDQPERAELIRVECEAERTDRDSPNYLKLLRRADQLEKAHAEDWFGPLSDEDFFVITRRGFVDRIALTADRFTANTEVIFDYAPLLQGLHINDGRDWQAFFSTPQLKGITVLSFDDNVFTLDAAIELATCKNLSNLIDLELDRQPLSLVAIAALVSARMPALQRLSMSECNLQDECAVRLFPAQGFRNLRELDLNENGLTNTTCHALAAATEFGQLEQLVLCNNHISANGIALLANAPHLTRLRSLNLYGNPIGPAGGRAILASRHWEGLRELNLIGCGVGVEVVNDLRWVYGEKAVKA